MDESLNQILRRVAQAAHALRMDERIFQYQCTSKLIGDEICFFSASLTFRSHPNLLAFPAPFPNKANVVARAVSVPWQSFALIGSLSLTPFIFGADQAA